MIGKQKWLVNERKGAVGLFEPPKPFRLAENNGKGAAFGLQNMLHFFWFVLQ
jgi:hypothetical protein